MFETKVGNIIAGDADKAKVNRKALKLFKWIWDSNKNEIVARKAHEFGIHFQ